VRRHHATRGSHRAAERAVWACRWAVFSPLDTGESRLHAHAGGPQYAQAYGLALRAA
jgi:hypothetical protein